MLSNIELILLSLINEKPAYAYELEKQIESRKMRMWVKIGVASVYQVLERLEKKGLLAAQREREGKAPPRKRYRITAAGEKALAEGAGRLLAGLEWYYLDLNVGLECSDLLSEAEIAGCLQKRLTKVRTNLKRLRELSRLESVRTGKAKAAANGAGDRGRADGNSAGNGGGAGGRDCVAGGGAGDGGGGPNRTSAGEKFAKKKAIIKNLTLFREAEEKFLQTALEELSSST